MTKNKQVVVSFGLVIVALIGIFLIMSPSKAHAQFRPCVWPNTCKNVA